KPTKNPIGGGDGQQIEQQTGNVVAGGRSPVQSVVDGPNQCVDGPVVIVQHLLLGDAAEHLHQAGQIERPVVVAVLDDVAIIVRQIEPARQNAGADIEQGGGNQH